MKFQIWGTVYFKPGKAVHINKEDPKRRTGLWLGFINHTNDYIVGTTTGIITCMAVRRKYESENHDSQNLNTKETHIF